MKKILTYIISIILCSLGCFAYAQTTFEINDTFFETTTFDSGNYSTINFGENYMGNDFGGVIFRGPSFINETELTMNGQTIYCKKQIRGLYINQARGNIIWPLDTPTLALLKSNTTLYKGYHKLSIEGGFFTQCTGDLIDNYNGIYGYIKHTTIGGQEYLLRAGFEYNPINHSIENNWASSLNRTIDTDSNTFKIKGYILDSYGQIGEIDTDWKLHGSIIFNTLSGHNASIKIHSNKNAIYQITGDFLGTLPQGYITGGSDLLKNITLSTGDGEKTIYLKLYTGNEEFYSNTQITLEPVDTTPPTIELISPSTGEAINGNNIGSGFINFIRSGQDLGGITNYTLYISGTNDFMVFPGITNTSKNIGGFTNGDYVWWVTAEDSNNNLGTSSISPFYVRGIGDTYPITITKTMTPSNPVVGEIVKFNINFTNTLNKFIKNVKVYDIMPNNLDANWNSIGDITDDFILLFSGELKPLEEKVLSFTGIITEKGFFENNAMIVTEGGFSAISAVQGDVTQSVLKINQSIIPDEDLLIDQDLEIEISIENEGDGTGYDIILTHDLSDIFVYGGSEFSGEENSFILFTGDLGPGEKISFIITGYTENDGILESTIKVSSSNSDNITNTIKKEINTNICGNGIIEYGYEQCDEGEYNGKIGHCSKSCKNNTYGVACKYADAQYLANGSFVDTLNHRGFEYIEIMRNSCLHRGKANYLGLWKYYPNENVTKAEVLKTLVKIRGIAKDDFNIVSEDTTYSGAITFDDVGANHWFARYSFYAYNNGLTEGLYSSKNGKLYLNPDGVITRNEIIKAVMTLYKEIVNSDNIDISNDSNMIDVKPGNKYYNYIREAEELGFISGYPTNDGKYIRKGDKALTRAEFAKIVSKPFEDILFGE